MFDVKIEFTLEAQYELYCHKSLSPIGSAHAGSVNRESARTHLTHCALNGLGVFVAEIRNNPLQATSFEKHHAMRGAEFRLERLLK